MPYGSLSKAYRTEIALGHLHANLVSLFKIHQRRLQKTKSMSGNINNRGKYKKKNPIYKNKNQNRDVTNGMQMKQTYRLKLLYFFICKEKNPVLRNCFTKENEFPQERDKCMFMIVKFRNVEASVIYTHHMPRGGGLFNTLSSTYIPNRKKKA